METFNNVCVISLTLTETKNGSYFWSICLRSRPVDTNFTCESVAYMKQVQNYPRLEKGRYSGMRIFQIIDLLLVLLLDQRDECQFSYIYLL